MSMSTHVVGIKPADETWKKFKAIWDACKAANVTPPEKVLAFFKYEVPDAAGVEVNLEKDPCCSKFRAEGCEGFEINLKLLPDDVTVIRFYNSW